MTFILSRLYSRWTKSINIFTRSQLKMSSNSIGSDHLNRTATNTRQNVESEATVMEIREISPSTKHLTLKIHNEQLTFKPGQWVDFHIPNLEKVGGFSMCSPPSKLRQNSMLHLAVKFSHHPPAYWVHKQCKVGSKVKVLVGGDFFYDPDPSIDQSDLLLIAGGVGINPLVSILGHISNMFEDKSMWSKRLPVTRLMYSASNRSELLFKDEIDKYRKRHHLNIDAHYFITQEYIEENYREVDMKSHRIDADTIDEVLSELTPNNVQCYICGPTTMLEELENLLLLSGVVKTNIHYEKWT